MRRNLNLTIKCAICHCGRPSNCGAFGDLL